MIRVSFNIFVPLCRPTCQIFFLSLPVILILDVILYKCGHFTHVLNHRYCMLYNPSFSMLANACSPTHSDQVESSTALYDAHIDTTNANIETEESGDATKNIDDISPALMGVLFPQSTQYHQYHT